MTHKRSGAGSAEEVGPGGGAEGARLIQAPVGVGVGAVTGADGRARCPWAATDPLLVAYHDAEWGRPVHSEQGLFERITLEAFQAGLAWRLVLARRAAFRAAFHNFNPDVVAHFTDADLDRLLADPALIRNGAKMVAARTNAAATVALRQRGGLDALVWSRQPREPLVPRTLAEVPALTAESRALAATLRAHGFVFVGPTTAFALMCAVGLVDAHLVDCWRRGGAQPGPAA